MKMISKVLLTAAAIAALAAPALAAVGDTKLIVKDNGGTTNVFTVDNTGKVTGAKLGMGTSDPRVPLHLHLLTGTGTVTDPGTTAIYSPSAGQVLSADRNSASAAFVVADNTATAGYRGSVAGVRAGGTLAVPTAPAVNDLVFSVIGGIWDGAAIRNTADINFTVDGAISSNVAPQRISFRTRTGGTGLYYERLTIKNDGKIILDPLAMPVYSDNTAAASLTAGTLYRTATGVLMIKY